MVHIAPGEVTAADEVLELVSEVSVALVSADEREHDVEQHGEHAEAAGDP